MAGGLFGWLDAIGLWWSSIFTGNRKKLLEDPEVAGEILRRAIDAQVADFGKHKDAVAELMAIVIGDKKTLERLQAEMRELEEESEGAVAAAKERAAALQRAGKTAAEIEADPQYMEALAAFEDNSSTTEEKRKRLDELSARIAANEAKVSDHKIMLQRAQREIQNLKVKADETKAAMYANQALITVNDRLAQMSERGTDKDAQEVFETADRLAAKAQISGELAGNDSTVARERFKAAGQRSRAKSKFADLVGIAGDKDKAAAGAVSAEGATEKRLPE